MHCLCNHSPALICVISLPPLPRSRYHSLPSLIPLVRDFQGPGSKSPFSPFSPGGLIIRIQPHSLKLMFLIQSQQSISKHPFLSLPTLFRWGGWGLEKNHVCVCVCVHVGPFFNLKAHIWQPSIRAVKVHTRAPPGTDETNLHVRYALTCTHNHTYFPLQIHSHNS